MSQKDEICNNNVGSIYQDSKPARALSTDDIEVCSRNCSLDSFDDVDHSSKPVVLVPEASAKRQNTKVIEQLKVSSPAMNPELKPKRFNCEICGQRFTEKGKVIICY